MLALIIFVLLAVNAPSQITVVNMTPNARSGETHQDSEPNLAVNPANPLQIVGSAFTPDPMTGANAPVYISVNGGNTWVLSSIVPSQAGAGHGSGTRDITVSFSGTTTNLYAGILRLPELVLDQARLNILRTNNFLAATPMDVLVDRNDVDQPYVQATTVLGGSGTGNDRVYVGNNDFAAPADHTATVDLSLNAATAPAPAGFTAVRIEHRTNAGQDGPPIRTAIHPDGTVYGIFYRRTAFLAGNNRQADIVVVRDDNWGSGATPFTDLVDPGDGIAGMRVATGVTFPFTSNSAVLGRERVGDRASIAVDPRDSDIVYIVWTDDNGSGNCNLHIRRSTDRGVTWSGNLRSVSNSLSPALAINIRGRVGFLYQQLTGTAPNQRWVTHLDRTDNAFTATNSIVLATVPNATPLRQFFPYIGDYIDLTAIGKDFYGVFSANNTPNNANFPQGVTYQRNHNFTTQTLLNTDGVTPVNVSIDPFFFHVDELDDDEDFYVRDWTDNATTHDTGLEPSTHPVFYTTSDVWNRRTNSSGGFNANDQPISQDPQISSLGNNFAFARVHRNQSGSAATVTLHFLKSELGTGSNYQNANTTSDPTLSFAAVELVKTMTSGYEWTLTATTSSHTCLAVEISTSSDPYVAPSVLGSAPGWPTTDLRFINDNNKAQRNMGVYSTSGDGSFSYFGIVHNAATFVRDIEIAYHLEPRILEMFGRPKIGVIGEEEKFYTFENELILTEMLPGENRWISLTITAPKSKTDELLPIIFEEIVDNMPINGFTIAARPVPLSEAILENLQFHGQNFIRMDAAFRIPGSYEEGKEALNFGLKKGISEEQYIEFLLTHIEIMHELLDELFQSRQLHDPFNIRKSIEELSSVARSKNVHRSVPVHSTLLHKMDAFMTMVQKAEGDPADILQNVRWQKDLYQKIKQLQNFDFTMELIKESEMFIHSYGMRRVSNDDYPDFIRHLMDVFRKTATIVELDNPDLMLENEIYEMERNLYSPTALQKAHRGYLIKLQTVVK